MKTVSLRLMFGTSLVTLAGLAGCAAPQKTLNPFALQRENDRLRAAMKQYQRQVADYRTKVQEVDADNEQLQSMLAEQQATNRRASNGRDTLAMGGPRDVQDDDNQDWADDPKEFGPARGGTGRAPSRGDSDSAGGWLPIASVSGAEVNRDGNAVRIRVTGANLFDPGKATLRPGASKVLDQVGSAIRSNYAGQLVGIEGHTDGDPIRKSNWKDNHELSVRRAMAVYEYLSSRGGVPSDQLYVAGFGSNVPIAANNSSAGKAKNRRVEFVIQPSDTWASQQWRSRN